jgi:hypothetical protein
MLTRSPELVLLSSAHTCFSHEFTLCTVCCALRFCLLQRAVIAAYLELVAELPWQTLSSERLVSIITTSHSRVYSLTKRCICYEPFYVPVLIQLHVCLVVMIHNSVSLAATRRQLDADHHGLEPIKVSNGHIITKFT